MIASDLDDIRRRSAEYQVDEAGVRDLYEEILASGETPQFAAMCALRQFPGVNTDTSYTAGQGSLADQFAGDEDGLDLVTKCAERQGYRPNNHDIYLTQLADKPGDPKAFVPSDRAKGHIRRVCEERGTACHGAVEVTAPQQEPKKTTRLAENLVEKHVNARIRANPDLKHKPRIDLRDQVIEDYGQKLD